MSRYIDADDLKENFIGVYEDEINFSFDGYAIKCIDDAPSIDIDLADDGTLSVEVEDATKVKRVLVEDGKSGDLYYADDRPQGEWIEVCKRTEQYDREGVKTWAVIYQCPACGFVLNAIENHTAQYNFCPNCGAKMKGANDERGR